MRSYLVRLTVDVTVQVNAETESDAEHAAHDDINSCLEDSAEISHVMRTNDITADDHESPSDRK